MNGDEIAKLLGHTSHIGTVNYSPDGKYIVTGSTDNSALKYLIDFLEQLIETSEEKKVRTKPIALTSYYSILKFLSPTNHFVWQRVDHKIVGQ